VTKKHGGHRKERRRKMAKIIKLKDFDREIYEPPLRARRGVRSETVGAPIKITMQHATVPPGGRNQRHYHVKCEVAMFILKGRLRMFFGPDQDEGIAEAGDFVYISQGEIHGLMNLSDTEPAEVLSSYSGVGSFDEAKTIFVEPPHK
jgi:uncharacterized RmlC-like cupin family protein